MSAQHNTVVARCARCAREVRHGRKSGTPVAHNCPHGKRCEWAKLPHATADVPACLHCQLEPQLAGAKLAGAAFRKVFG